MKLLRKLAIRMLLGWKEKEFFDLVSLGGRSYMIDIHPYEPADEFVGRMEKALQEQGRRSDG